MFTRMRMVNFKSWADTGEIPLAPLTGFLGANSSGKSSLLQMLLLLKQTTESNDRSLVLKTGNLQEGYVNLGTIPEITYRDTSELTMAVGWTLPESLHIPIPNLPKHPALQLDVLNFFTEILAMPNEIAVQRFEYTGDRLIAGMRREDRKPYKIFVEVDGRTPKRPQARPRVPKPEKSYGFSDEALRFYQQTDFLSDLVLALEQQFSRLYYLGPLREYPQRIYTWAGERPSDVGVKGELTVPALLAGKDQRVYRGKGKQARLEERVASWIVEMGLAHSFETSPLVEGGMQYEVRLRRTADSPPVLISDMGFGVSQVLPVLVLCYYAPEGSTLILEQPELHLHPAVQSALADVFVDVIKRRNIQIILESHSEHLLRRVQLRIAEGKLNPTQTAFYFCTYQSGTGDRPGASAISALEIDEFGTIRNWPKDFFGDLTGDLYQIAQLGIARQMQNGR